MNHADMNKSRLLAVDDNSDSAELIARVAAKCGYDARSMTDSSTLGRVLDEWKPQVLTLDLCMPEEDGISVLSLLKQSGFAGNVGIIWKEAGDKKVSDRRQLVRDNACRRALHLSSPSKAPKSKLRIRGRNERNVAKLLRHN